MLPDFQHSCVGWPKITTAVLSDSIVYN